MFLSVSDYDAPSRMLLEICILNFFSNDVMTEHKYALTLGTTYFSYDDTRV